MTSMRMRVLLASDTHGKQGIIEQTGKIIT